MPKPSKEKELGLVGWKSISNRGNVQCCSFKKATPSKTQEEGKNLAFLRNQGGLLWLVCGETGSKRNPARLEVPAWPRARKTLEVCLPPPERHSVLGIRS